MSENQNRLSVLYRLQRSGSNEKAFLPPCLCIEPPERSGDPAPAPFLSFLILLILKENILTYKQYRKNIHKRRNLLRLAACQIDHHISDDAHRNSL